MAEKLMARHPEGGTQLLYHAYLRGTAASHSLIKSLEILKRMSDTVSLTRTAYYYVLHACRTYRDAKEVLMMLGGSALGVRSYHIRRVLEVLVGEGVENEGVWLWNYARLKGVSTDYKMRRLFYRSWVGHPATAEGAFSENHHAIDYEGLLYVLHHTQGTPWRSIHALATSHPSPTPRFLHLYFTAALSRSSPTTHSQAATFYTSLANPDPITTSLYLRLAAATGDLETLQAYPTSFFTHQGGLYNNGVVSYRRGQETGDLTVTKEMKKKLGEELKCVCA
eukprot:TRINITY_DN718_c1_g1_i1.p1 TRINITY_DN718_c1_g1~~TRINITY_DN718_c1_g1_i1.p1  ORF type:complete len:305 (+),score=39.62 TRINITY_DN718_c1_g1_i1:78-917(+)